MKKTYILSMMLFAMAVAGCKKSLDQTVNPNSPSVASPQSVLSGALSITAIRTETDYSTFGIWLGYYAPSGNFVPSTNTNQYVFTNSSFNVFNPLFSNLTNYNYLIQKAASDASLANFGAISTVMFAYNYQLLVDNYDNVPYSQALNSQVYLFPKYDGGESIYDDLLLKLDAAIATINASGSAVNPGASDIVFQGSMAKWKKFANTLKLRIALRQTKLASKKAALVTELAKTSAEGYLDDLTFAQAQPGYLSSDANGGQQNPYYKVNAYNAAGVEQSGHQTARANNFFITFLKNRGNDTIRLKRIYAAVASKAEQLANPTAPVINTAAHIVGNTFGDDVNSVTNAYSSALGLGIIPGPTAAAVILNGSEACYLVAEAIVDGYIPGTVTGGAGSAQDYYQRGIIANFVALGAADTFTGRTATQCAIDYYSQPVVDVNWVASAASTTPGNTLGPLVRAIQTQKYISLFGFEIQEAYNEFRRTGFPDLQGARSVAAGANGTGPVPNRIYYPVTEYSTNAAAVGALPAVSPFVTKIFWAL